MSQKQYDRAAFQKLERPRQLTIMLKWIRELESQHPGADSASVWDVNVLVQYLSWLDPETTQDGLRSRQLLDLLKTSPPLRRILDVGTALERALAVSVKDHDFLVSVHDSSSAKSHVRPQLFLVLDNLRSAFNVGSIFRTAEGLGVAHIYLVGFTPTPGEAPVQKTAMGADQLVPWSSHSRADVVIEDLKSKGVQLVALETAMNSESIYSHQWRSSSALFFGNERFGLHSERLRAMDSVLHIPMRGRKNSLNVATALGISLSEMGRQLDSR